RRKRRPCAGIIRNPVGVRMRPLIPTAHKGPRRTNMEAVFQQQRKIPRVRSLMLLNDKRTLAQTEAPRIVRGAVPIERIELDRESTREPNFHRGTHSPTALRNRSKTSKLTRRRIVNGRSDLKSSRKRKQLVRLRKP